ncbi:deleted in azoospermia-like [Montipora capricornis]|uniref:deleted in azoospermia-like n=1 Tax=Montipora capricornis TaxID=246305 RepID=UPI0035F20382
MAYLPSDSALPMESFFKIPYRIFVGGIAFNTTKEELKDFFSRYGAVRDTKIIRDPEGLSKGYGFVTFYREEDAQKVMNMGTIFFKEKRLCISEAFRKPQSVAHQQPIMMTVPVAGSTDAICSSDTTIQCQELVTGSNSRCRCKSNHSAAWSSLLAPPLFLLNMRQVGKDKQLLACFARIIYTISNHSSPICADDFLVFVTHSLRKA